MYESYDEEARCRMGVGREYDPDYRPFLYNADEEALYATWKADYDRRLAAGEELTADTWTISHARAYRWQDGFLVSVFYALIFVAGFWYVTCIKEWM
jgi:hypothetical protein